MTSAQIQKEQERANVKFQVALQLKEILDAARKAYGPTNWDDEDMNGEISRLVFED